MMKVQPEHSRPRPACRALPEKGRVTYRSRLDGLPSRWARCPSRDETPCSLGVESFGPVSILRACNTYRADLFAIPTTRDIK